MREGLAAILAGLGRIFGPSGDLESLCARWERLAAGLQSGAPPLPTRIHLGGVVRVAFEFFGRAAPGADDGGGAYLALDIARSGLRVVFVDTRLEQMGDNVVAVAPLAAGGPWARDWAYSVRMREEPRIRGKEAHVVGQFVAACMSAERLHLLDRAAICCEAGCEIRHFSLLRAAAGLPGLYEARDAEFEQPEEAEKARAACLAYGRTADPETGRVLAEEIREHLERKGRQHGPGCRRVARIAEALFGRLSPRERAAFGSLYWRLPE